MWLQGFWFWSWFWFWGWVDLVFSVAVAVLIVGVAVAATTAGAADFHGSEVVVIVVTAVRWTNGVLRAVVWGAISIEEGAIFIVIVANWLWSWSDIILIWLWDWGWGWVLFIEWVVAFTVGLIWVAVATTAANAAHEFRDECVSIVLSAVVLGAPVRCVSSAGVAIGVGGSEVGVPAGLRGRRREFNF